MAVLGRLFYFFPYFEQHIVTKLSSYYCIIEKIVATPHAGLFSILSIEFNNGAESTVLIARSNPCLDSTEKTR